jgi:hypothetical protein
MAGRLSLKDVNEELARRGHRAELRKAVNYFYFAGGEAAEWLDTSVGVRTLNTLTLKEWVEEFVRLQQVNRQIMGTAGSRKPAKQQ